MNFKNGAELKCERESTINLSIRRRIRTSGENEILPWRCVCGQTSGCVSKVFSKLATVPETTIRTLLLHCGRNTSYNVCLSCRESKAWRLERHSVSLTFGALLSTFVDLRKARQPKGFESKRQTAHSQIVSCIDSSRINAPERPSLVGNVASAGQLVCFTAAATSLLRIRRTPLVVMASKLDVNSCIMVVTNAL